MQTEQSGRTSKAWDDLPPRFYLAALLFFAATDLAGGSLIGNESIDLLSGTLVLRLIQLIGLLGIIRYFGLFDAMGWRYPDRQAWRVLVLCAAIPLAGALSLLMIWPEVGRVFHLQGYVHGIGGMLLMFAVAPLVEEGVFRGVLYRMLRGAFGIYAAVAVSALLFALMHGSIMLPQLAGGLIFAIAYEWSRNLWVPVLLHAGGNVLIWSGLLTTF